MVRQLVFSSIRFQFQRFNKGQPSEVFGDQTLSILERPWPGGTTQDLLSRMIQDADLAGNSYWVRQGDELVRLRPDWVQIVGKRDMIHPHRRAGRSAGTRRATCTSRAARLAERRRPLLGRRGGALRADPRPARGVHRNVLADTDRS
jgi:hypothetical protein